MKSNLKLLLIAGVALAGLSGCATSEKTAAAAPAVHHSLEGGPWKVVSFDDGSIVPENVNVDLTFDPGDHNTSRVSGSSGCNRFNGGWQQNGSSIKLGPIMGSMMMCDDAKMKVEGKLLAVLNAASTLSWDADGTAKISTADGKWVKLRRAT